jgi:hypothetical protein
MDMSGTYEFELTGKALKNIMKEYKVLKKFNKGKIELIQIMCIINIKQIQMSISS